MPNSTNLKLTDQDIVNEMLKDSKTGLNALTMALTEATNPQLRNMLADHLNTCIEDHFKLADMATQKNWYKANLEPMALLKEDISSAQMMV